MSKTTAEILKKARTRLVEKGWRQGAFADLDGRCCALGAIWSIPCSVGDEEKAKDALRVAIGCNGITDWNDADGRTKKQVLGAFTRAINAELKSNS